MKMLDMGTGSGILALYSAMRGADVTASDIDPAAISEARNAARLLGMSMTFCLSDLFTDVPGKFDLVLFNPPYLPSASFDDKSVDGGPNGTLITNRFLKDLPAHLEKRAHGFLILTSLNDPDSIRERHSNLRFSVVAKRSLFFEELRVLRVGLRNDLAVQ
jgi:release factor glutamine methyltransferase